MVPELGSVLAVQQVAPQRPLSHPAPATRLSRQAFAAEAELGVPLTLERFIRWTSRLDAARYRPLARSRWIRVSN